MKMKCMYYVFKTVFVFMMISVTFPVNTVLLPSLASLARSRGYQARAIAVVAAKTMN